MRCNVSSTCPGWLLAPPVDSRATEITGAGRPAAESCGERSHRGCGYRDVSLCVGVTPHHVDSPVPATRGWPRRDGSSRCCPKSSRHVACPIRPTSNAMAGSRASSVAVGRPHLDVDVGGPRPRCREPGAACPASPRPAYRRMAHRRPRRRAGVLASAATSSGPPGRPCDRDGPATVPPGGGTCRADQPPTRPGRSDRRV